MRHSLHDRRQHRLQPWQRQGAQGAPGQREPQAHPPAQIPPLGSIIPKAHTQPRLIDPVHHKLHRRGCGAAPQCQGPNALTHSAGRRQNCQHAQAIDRAQRQQPAASAALSPGPGTDSIGRLQPEAQEAIYQKPQKYHPSTPPCPSVCPGSAQVMPHCAADTFMLYCSKNGR